MSGCTSAGKHLPPLTTATTGDAAIAAAEHNAYAEYHATAVRRRFPLHTPRPWHARRIACDCGFAPKLGTHYRMPQQPD
jgi:hypothetical protein